MTEPNPIVQRKLARIFGDDFWLPKICLECNAVIERKAKIQAAHDEADDLRKRLWASDLPRPYLTKKITSHHLDAGPQTEGFIAARIACGRLITGGLDQPFVYLWSEETGTYKSILACLALYQAIVAGGRGAYLNWPMFLERLKSTYSDDSKETVYALLQVYINAPWLVVDELGAGKSKQFSPDILQILLNARFELDCIPGDIDGSPLVLPAEPGKRGVIFTSNKSVAGIVDQVKRSAIDDPDQAKRIERRLSEPTLEIPIMG